MKKRLPWNLFVTALTLCTSLNAFAALTGYIGNQSFDIREDRKLKQHEQEVQSVKKELDIVVATAKNQEAAVQRAQQNVKAQNDQLAVSKKKIDDLQNEVASLQEQNKGLNEALKTATTEEQKTELKNKIAANKQLIDSKKESLPALKSQQESIKLALANAQGALEVEKTHLQKQNQLVEAARSKKQQIAAERDAYEQQLMAKILEANKEGAREGRDDGQLDGLNLAKDLGIEEGYGDGKIDGRSNGIRAGERRDYSLGYDEGSKIGVSMASEQGEIDGTKEGTISGNTIAAKREGTEAGEARAEKSDAAQVGSAQGKSAGLERAVNTGKRVGEEKGEAQSIKQNESGTLNSVKIAGQFAAAFDKDVPSYPGPTKKNYSTIGANQYQRDVVRRAYLDGYDFRYRNASQNQFENNIDSLYNDAYQSAHEKNYYQFYNQFYQERFAEGKRVGQRESYASVYPGVKRDYFNRYESLFERNPNRQASEYVSTFRSSEGAAYSRHYEQIRSDYFDRVEESTFAANIDAQTEKYRALRFAQVESIYKKSAILSFVSSEMIDAGIKGIAKNDGVFQPTETTHHTITIKNYGQVAAQGVVAMLNSGERVVLPSIPARSQATIEHAVAGTVGNLPEESTLTRALSLSFSLSEEPRIQGRHFDSLRENLLTDSDVKQVAVRYPLLLTGLSTSTQLFKDAVTPITLTVNNRSNRKYTGPLTINLVSSKPEVINSPFATIQAVESTTASKNATLLVRNNNDIYTPMTFSATISQNGILLGKVDRSFTTMAKSKFINREGTPIVLANSDASANSLLRLVNELGGIERVSILDTSLRTLNATALTQSYADRLAIVLPKSGVLTDSAPLVASAQNLVMMVLADESAQKELTNQPVFADQFAVSFDVKDLEKKSIVSSNPHRVAGHKGYTTVLSASENNYDEELALANALTLSTEALLAKIDREIELSDYFSLRPLQSVLISALHIKTLMELGTINIAYDLSKKPGLFGTMLFGKRDKKWLEMVEGDQNLAIAKMKKYAEQTLAKKLVTPSLLAIYQNTFAVENGLELYRPIAKNILDSVARASSKVTSKTQDALAKGLKSLNRTIYNQVNRDKHLYTPFEPGEDTDCGPGDPGFPGCHNGH